MSNKKCLSPAGKISFSIDFSDIVPMLGVCEQLLKGTLQKEELLQVLNRKSYRFEFSRYEGILSQEEFVDYFLKLPQIKEDEISNPALQAHHSCYRHLLDNLDLYQLKAEELRAILTNSDISHYIGLALAGLPDDLHLPDLSYIFSISIGPSFGYYHENGMHFDFLRLVKDDISLAALGSTIAHETHHAGMNLLYEMIDLTTLSLEELFYIYFSGEGLAVKYCNNAEGVISKAIHQGDKNIGLDKFSWEYLNNDFDDTMAQFKKTVGRLRNREFSSPEELLKHIQEYWMNSHTKDQRRDELPKLHLSRLYSFGNDIWGLIHDCFGEEAVFETLKNPGKFPDIFNRAVEQIGRKDLQI